MKRWLCDDSDGNSVYCLAPDWECAESVCWANDWELVGEYVRTEEFDTEGLEELWGSQEFLDTVEDMRGDEFWNDVEWENNDE